MKRELVSLISHYAGNEGAIMIMMHGHLLVRHMIIHFLNLVSWLMILFNHRPPIPTA
jgi:hypothetical protein